ncbi:MAG TPA: YdiU family protein [Opitutaceae bacterium]|nr:YdiU family protein [Opitutaceae bacterium]
MEHSYAQLPVLFHVAVAPTPVRSPRLVVLNRPLAEFLGLDADALATSDVAAIFAGNRLPPGAAPLAQAYAGHQYGHFTTLGDGRAILLGEQITRDERFDIQLKGAGPTPFSRRGDGRAALGPMLREYIVSEAMHALGIPTTRSLAVAATGEDVYRQTVLPGAVLTRVAASHLRVGTFEWAAAKGDTSALRTLVDYTIRRHYPARADAADPACALLDAVIERQAALIARWMLVGFVHGVMNTDNMAISGETIDYGPCAFMDAYDPATVFSSIDIHGRYAYGSQPSIAQWNLARLAETLLPLLHAEEPPAIAVATAALKRFATSFQQHWLAGMRRKLGLFSDEPEDTSLIEALLAWMQSAKADFTNTFAELTPDLPPGHFRRSDAGFMSWHERWRARLDRQTQSRPESETLRRAHNPAFIPRNHLVEAALAAAEQNDLGPMKRLLDVLATPYDHLRAAPNYREPAPASAACYQTFCGT